MVSPAIRMPKTYSHCVASIASGTILLSVSHFTNLSTSLFVNHYIWQTKIFEFFSNDIPNQFIIGLDILINNF